MRHVDNFIGHLSISLITFAIVNCRTDQQLIHWKALCESKGSKDLSFSTLLCLAAVLDAMSKHKDAFPVKEDFDGAITALLRLQDTYQLQPSSFSQQKLPGSVPSPKMSVGEVYDVGRHAYLNGDMFYTKTWMEEALNQYNKQDNPEDVLLFDIYDHLSFSEYKVRDEHYNLYEERTNGNLNLNLDL